MADQDVTLKIKEITPKVLSGLTALLLLMVVFAPSSFANILGNPNFDQSLGNGTESNWQQNFDNPCEGAVPAGWPAACVFLPERTVTSGVNAVHLKAYYQDVGFYRNSYTFQVRNDVKEGDLVTFSAKAQTDIKASEITGGSIAIEFKNESDVKISEKITSGIKINTAPLGSWTTFTAQAEAPAGTKKVVFVLKADGISGGSATYGNIYFTETNGEVNPAKLTVAASKRNVQKGDAIGINAHFNNASGNTFTGAQMRINIPHGFDYANNSIRVNGVKANYHDGSLIIPIGTLMPGAQFDVVFALLVTSGVQLGKHYSLDVTVENGSNLSERARVQFTIKSGEPMFDDGTIIGKVFNDLNQDGVQQCGEQGVPWVRLYTENGIAIVTDENGLYHIPAVDPGRHIVKIDGHTLPEGTKFITEESYLVKITPGIMGKADFAVLLPPSKIPENFKKDLMVMVTQGVDVSKPQLEIQINPQIMKIGIGIPEKEPAFRIDSNYVKFIKKWSIEVRDGMGQEIWTGYGVGQPPPEVTWSGMTESGALIKPGIYSYQLKVFDEKGRSDWTPLKFFEVYNKLDPKAQKNYEPEIPAPVGDFNIMKDGKRTIPLIAKPTVRVQGKTKPEYEIKINGAPVSVDPGTGMFQKEFFVSPGEHEFQISATNPSGESTVYQEKIKVKDSTFFMVALGEEQLGINFASGAMEDADSDVYRDGFREGGRLAFFLKGKLKGKFLVKARYDTSDKRTALFTNLDPDDYYPIYGDSSSRDYEAQETAQRLFVLVEMDKSYVKWGSFKTEFTDTELATYNRTLSGLKASFDTVASNVYGDPARGVKVFWAESTKQADHNELYATGGTLFYTRNRNIIEGSEKIRVEIRDKIQGMVLTSYDLQGSDYQIDYDEGRILLARPLSSVAASDTLVSADIMDGNPVYLIVDYEYDPASTDLPEVTDSGIRAYTWVGDHLKVGGTAVNEKRPGQDYNLRGLDATVKFGRNTQITAEYATSNIQQMNSSISYNGGLTYSDEGNLPNENNRERDSAYLIKGQSQPIKGLDLSGYLQGVGPGFSNGHMASQEGLEKYGVAASYKFTESLAARYRYDSSSVYDSIRPLTNYPSILMPYMKARTQTVQLVYDDGKYLAQAEYRNSNINQIPDSVNLLPTLDSEVPFQSGIAGKLGYHLNDRLLPYVKAQVTMKSSRNYQLGGGIRCELIRNVFGYVEQMFGPLGDSTYFGFERQHGNGGRSYANLRSTSRGIGDKTLASAIGSSFSLSEKSRIYTEREYSSYQGINGFADILGFDGALNDHYDYGAKFERRHLTTSMVRAMSIAAGDALAPNCTSNTVGAHLGYADGKKLRARTYWEVRVDTSSPTLSQLATQNSLQYQINRDLAFLTYFNYGDTSFHNPGNIPAAFIELNTGFAYRPVGLSKFNMLTKYTYIRNRGDDVQYDNSYYNGVQFDDSAHIVAVDAIYDINRWFGIAEKLAFKRANLMISTGDDVGTNNFLTVNRLNFHVTRKWDVAAEYRLLWQSGALDTLRHGALCEIDREIYDYVRLGVGYNFTDFSDDLRDANDFKGHGPFVRMTGKF